MNPSMFAESFNLMSRYSELSEFWSPKVVAEVNDQYVKIAKLKGQLVWHDHAGEDELFFVVRGNLVIEYPGDRKVVLPEGSMHVVPRGTMHNPVAAEECWIVLIEPKKTRHTGTVQSQLTRSIEEQLS
jgi:mannose-6-phosphate isomerase-like protein (cupin superfamily)